MPILGRKTADGLVSHDNQGIYSLTGHLTARSREVSKPRDSSLDFSNRSDLWQTPRQRRCRDACEISERYDYYYIKSRRFETSRDLAVRRYAA